MRKLFHPAVSNWFEETFEQSSEIQKKAWPEIKKGNHTLISAPTGSGKTLAAFLASIDSLIKDGLNNELPESTMIVYVSPLKALSNDIEKNLQKPLKGIRESLLESGYADVKISVGLRTGDTTPSQRTAMIKHPPHILVTTPESLYLLLTSVSGRKMLAHVNTVIVDEIHALIGDKRGSHLSLSLERLENLVQGSLTRIGLSATQKPIQLVSKFLTGVGKTCTIVDTGHKRKLDLSIEIPSSPLTALMANEVWGEVYNQLQDLIESHNTTIIFVNTRRLAERLAHNLSERMGDDNITAHHGSMSKEHRHLAETRLKEGKLKALVATASLELGIDIGYIDLVCQIGSPRSIAAFLQRVGRSGHTLKGTPKGKIFPLSRDELVECTAILDAVRRGELDAILMPEQPIDILSQQIVAELAAEEYQETDLFNICKKAYPFRDLKRERFDEIIDMLSNGFATRKGRRSAYVHHDKINERVKGRKNARLTALTSGGSIPDNFDTDVILESQNAFIGTLNEDFAIESMPGDVFQLGNNSWRILRVETGKVLVEDAQGQPPTIPFWLGEAPGRTSELSIAVSRLRRDISERLGDLSELKRMEDYEEDEMPDETWKREAMSYLMGELGLNESAADQLIMYLAATKAALGVMPTQETLVLERFFDEAGDMHLVVHSPFGSRLNRAWGLSLRKRFCKKFNFELQAAATEDAVILSLGATHSFPLEEVFTYLNSKTVKNILIQALLDSPMFEIRWRWNASRALATLRRRAGKRVPPQIQRMNAEDLVALIFPDQLACFENIDGEREVPDHPLVEQTIHDCLTEAMDIDSLETLIDDIRDNKKELIVKDLREPSPLSQEILLARPYAFLDDAPAEERRTNAVINRRWIDPAEAKDLGRLDENAIKAVKEEAWPQVASEDELHDALVLFGFLTEKEGFYGNGFQGWESYFAQLVQENRANSFKSDNGETLWIASERIPQFRIVYPKFILDYPTQLPDRIENEEWDYSKALIEIMRGRMEALGPVMPSVLIHSSGLPESVVQQSLLGLESEGFIFRGQYTQQTEEIEWCERRLLARIHRYTLQKLRKEIEPVSSSDFMRYLFNWQHLDKESRLEGPDSMHKILEQLEGYESSAASWESDILPARIKEYDFMWLDVLCLSGRTIWGKFRHTSSSFKNGSTSPIKATPISLVSRTHLEFWKKLGSNHECVKELSNHATSVYEVIKTRGAIFFDDIVTETQLFKVQVEEAMAELVSKGLITSDSFTGLRALLVPQKHRSARSRRKKRQPFAMEHAGRWSVIHQNENTNQDLPKEDIEQFARVLLKRYGVVFRKMVEREKSAPPWRALVRIYRILEARGEIRGGRFVQGVYGEQFALAEAVVRLRKVKKEQNPDQYITISASDPLNLTGIITSGPKVSNHYGNRILYHNGIPAAIKEGKEIEILLKNPENNWELKNKLIQRDVSPKLRAYLGKGIL